jgi:lysophospholipase L1-like esterase
VAHSRSDLIAGLAGLLLIAAACGPGPASAPGEQPTAAMTGETPLATTPSGATSDASSPTSSSAAIPALPEGAVAIATFGDSLTEGDCDDSGRGYPGRLLPMVERLRPGSKILNVGHSGWTSGDLANTANDPPTDIARAIDSEPDMALVWIGSNDLWALYEFGPEPMTGAAEQEDLAAYEANLDVLLGRLTDKGAAVYIALLDDQSMRPVVANPPDPSQPAFPATTSADLTLMADHVTAYNDIIRAKAAQYGAVTVDFYNTTIFTTEATLCSDGNHPNESGYDAIAAIWFTALEPALR